MTVFILGGKELASFFDVKLLLKVQRKHECKTVF